MQISFIFFEIIFHVCDKSAVLAYSLATVGQILPF
jgi:hypothetical protein